MISSVHSAKAQDFLTDWNAILALAQKFTYANPHAATAVSSTVYTYDTNGNLTSDSLWTHTWDYRNRLTQSTKAGATSTYAYDHTNTRVKLLTAATTTIIASPNYSTEAGIPVKYILGAGQLLATIRGSGASSTLYAIHPGHLGSQVKTTNASGSIVELSDYYPFGSLRTNTQYGVDDRKGYIGKDFDTDTGLSQLEARYYMSSVGRFMSQDPVFWEKNQKLADLQSSNSFWAIGLSSAHGFSSKSDAQDRGSSEYGLGGYLADPQAQNSYSYARNNPLAYKDTGGQVAQALIPGMVGVASGLGMRYVVDVYANMIDLDVNGFSVLKSRSQLREYAGAAAEGAATSYGAFFGGRLSGISGVSVGAGVGNFFGQIANDYISGNLTSQKLNSGSYYSQKIPSATLNAITAGIFSIASRLTTISASTGGQIAQDIKGEFFSSAIQLLQSAINLIQAQINSRTN